MGQQHVANILENVAPKLLSVTEITTLSKYGRVSTIRCLNALVKREEIIYIITRSGKPQGNWIKKYGVKEEQECQTNLKK